MFKYIVQIDDEVREATKDETARIKAIHVEQAEREQAKIDRAELKAATIAKLGLTADEVAALFS
jgi:hypothetical protein